MSVEWIERAIELIGEGESFTVITICAAEGSAPREAGAKMIVTRHKQWGTIGGGALEFEAAAHARALLSEEASTSLFEEFPLGPALGQCCGGRVLLLYERIGPTARAWLEDTRNLVSDNKDVVLERTFPGGDWRPSDQSAAVQNNTIELFSAINEAHPKGIPDPAAITRIREVVSNQRIPVYIFGAGHVGKELARILSALPVTVTWIDRRADVFPESIDVSTVPTDRETEIVDSAPPGACFFVMTHDHQLDYDLVLHIMKRADGAYCGLIGSFTKRVRFEKRLRRAGVSDTQIEHLRCPIGAGGVKSKLPAVIALGAAHEMLIAHQQYQKGEA
jgi:xanthine dehydrogenase accessory factor